MPYKVFVAGEEALASDANSYLMSQTVPRFTSAAQRTSQLTAPVLNQLSIRDDSGGLTERWNGASWEPVGSSAELFYGQTTAPVSVVNTSSATSHLVVEGAARSYDGSPIIVEFFAPNVVSPSAANIYFGLLDGVVAQQVLGYASASSGAIGIPVCARYRFAPSIGTHTYRIGSWVSSGTGTVNAGNGAVNQVVPASLRIIRA
jgi:hypothetical protein